MAPQATRLQLHLHKARKNRPGFSLIELLAVILVISILSTLIIVGVTNVRTKAHSMQCIANLRQISFDFDMYAQENNGKLIPRTADFPAGISSWLDEVSMSVYGSLAKRPYHGCDETRSYLELRDIDRTYSYNESAMRHTPGLTRDQLINPGNTMAVADGVIKNGRYNYICLQISQLPYPIHADKANILFYDGHVEARPLDEIPTEAGPRGTPSWDFWYGVP
ncbi:MAG: prepilin-type N-terminal cleavage/methylation domain-containing protein [Verrucomicrobiota bacterium JB024]|nr:prepilin-type N-terminal cleavage/methylation domain-containing protein [Verrucomicrobiota bacterium JB024]